MRPKSYCTRPFKGHLHLPRVAVLKEVSKEICKFWYESGCGVIYESLDSWDLICYMLSMRTTGGEIV